jgi:hypothetical protein
MARTPVQLTNATPHGCRRDAKWNTLYLQANGHFQQQCPGVLAKIMAAVRAADAAEHTMQLLSGKRERDVGVRCIEYHQVQVGGALPERKHMDRGSLVTVDVLLSEPRVDFEGGDFCTLESDGALLLHKFGGRDRSGDALLFVSHKYHCVQPVQSGVRRVLVIELWLGPDRTCEHRCNHPKACSLEFRPEEVEAMTAADDSFTQSVWNGTEWETAQTGPS